MKILYKSGLIEVFKIYKVENEIFFVTYDNKEQEEKDDIVVSYYDCYIKKFELYVGDKEIHYYGTEVANVVFNEIIKFYKHDPNGIYEIPSQKYAEALLFNR